MVPRFYLHATITEWALLTVSHPKQKHCRENYVQFFLPYWKKIQASF